jgi:sulfonate transport system substrate-binding protein
MMFRHHLRHAAAAAAVLSLSAGLAACGSGSSSSGSGGGGSSPSGSAAAAQPTTATTTATVAADTNSNLPPLIVGDQAGTGAQALLQASGLIHKLPFTLKFADFTSGPPILEAMSSGSVDIGGVGNAPPVFAAAGGAKIAIVGARSNNPKSAALLVPKGSSATSIQDLKGKKIAVAQGSSADYHLLAVLTKAGMTPKDVQLVYLQPAEAQAALSSGAVDAWDVWSPFIEAAKAKGAKQLVDGTGYGGNYAYEVASKAAIASPTKSKEIKQYLKVLDQAYRWANTHSSSWAKTWAAATGLPVSVMDVAAQDATTQPIPVSDKTTQSEQTLADAFAKAGLIPKSYQFAPYSSDAFNASVH